MYWHCLLYFCLKMFDQKKLSLRTLPNKKLQSLTFVSQTSLKKRSLLKLNKPSKANCPFYRVKLKSLIPKSKELKLSANNIKMHVCKSWWGNFKSAFEKTTLNTWTNLFPKFKKSSKSTNWISNSHPESIPFIEKNKAPKR